MNTKAAIPASDPKPKVRLIPILAILLCAFLALLAGCSAQSQSTSAATATTAEAAVTTATQTIEGSSTNSSAPEPTATSTASESEPASSIQPLAVDDLIIEFQETKSRLLEDASPLLTALGDDFQFSEAESCAYEGMDKTFEYGHVVVYTIPSGDLDLLDGIDVLDTQIATARGIRVGDSREAVLAVYGPQAGSEADLVYNVSGDIQNLAEPKISFIMDGDTVVAISFYSGSNAQG